MSCGDRIYDQNGASRLRGTPSIDIHERTRTVSPMHRQILLGCHIPNLGSLNRTVLKRLLFPITLLILATAASGFISGPIVISPSSPSERDVIRATFTEASSGCQINISTVVTGTVVRTTMFISSVGCVSGPPPVPVPREISFGPLAPNTYTYEFYEDYEGGPQLLISRQPLVVSAAPPIPALSSNSLVLLVVALTGIALSALGRATGQ